jgi:hypothetical protein
VLLLQVGTASIVAVLSGIHASSIVKIAWSPEYAAYGSSASWGQRLASVDEAGKAVVWDVSTASPLTVCSSVNSGECTSLRTLLSMRMPAVVCICSMETHMM